MSITQLSTEILQKTYEYATLQDVLHLAQTSKKNYKTYLGRRMAILERAMHNSYSPLPDLLKLVISNEPDKLRKPVGTEVRRTTILNRIIQTSEKQKLSLEMLKKMVHYGNIADRWTEFYPQLRWRFGSSNRRLLHNHEKERLRQAIYHYWTYTNLFHDRTFLEYAPDPPHSHVHQNPDLRLRLLRTYNTIELIQLSEFIAHIMQLIQHDLFPSNTIVQEHYAQRLPPRALARTAWGDGPSYQHLVHDILKLSPEAILHLVEDTTTKAERSEYILAQGEWFDGVPASMNATLSAVVREREIVGMAKGPRLFPSFSWLPYAKEDDEDVLFGVVAVEGTLDEMLVYERHAWARDASLTGEWVPLCRSRMGLARSSPNAVDDGLDEGNDDEEV